MPNTVRDWMSKPVVVVDPDSSVKYALTLMRRRKIHSVLVAISEKNPTYGIVTSTDIRDKIVAAGRNPAEMSVRDIMSRPHYHWRPRLDVDGMFAGHAATPYSPSSDC